MKVLWIATPLLALLAAACSLEGEKNFYTPQLVKACGKFVRTVDTLGKSTQPTRLTDECRNALNGGLIPYDSTFNAQPALKERVNEAFQAIISYPMAYPPTDDPQIPPYSIFNVGAYTVSAWHRDLLDADPNMNKTLLNYVLNQVSKITFDPDIASHVASYGISGLDGAMTIYPTFWNNDGLETISTSPLRRMLTLVHEARHGDGYLHQFSGKKDSEFTGPYGFAIIVGELLLRGGGNDGSDPTSLEGFAALHNWDLLLVGLAMCRNAKGDIQHRPPELVKLLASIDCEYIHANWVAQQEHLHREKTMVH